MMERVRERERESERMSTNEEIITFLMQLCETQQQNDLQSVDVANVGGP